MNYWVVWNAGNNTVQIVQQPAAPATPQSGKVFGPYKTLAQAQAEATPSNNPLAGAGAGISAGLGQATGGAVGTLPTYSNPLEDIGNFFHALTQSSTWVRVGEVAAGGIVLIVGLRALATSNKAGASATRKTVTRPAKRVASKAASVAVPEVRLATRTVAKRTAPKTTARVAAHRQQVATYGQKKAYVPPKPRQPTVIHHKTTKTVNVHHTKGPKTP